MVLLRNKFAFLQIVIVLIIISSTGLYLNNYNSASFQPINHLTLSNLDGWNYNKIVNVSSSNNIVKIVSGNDNYTSWYDVNSKGFNVSSGEAILFNLCAKYNNTLQSSTRIIGNTSNGQCVLGYFFIVNGNSSWNEYSVKISVPIGVNSVFLQIPIGWALQKNKIEFIMIKDLLIYELK